MNEIGQTLKRSVAERQARVGIVANPKSVSMPRHAPRDVWTRWPKLRSSRRQGASPGAAMPAEPPPDPVLSGEALKDFARELRAGALAQEEGQGRGRAFSERLDALRELRTGHLLRRLGLLLVIAAIVWGALSLT